MIVAAVTTLCALVGLIFLLQARRRFRRRRLGSCALHVLSSLVFLLAAGCAALLGFDLLSYERLTREQPALEAQFTRLGEQQFDVVLTYPSGVTERYAMRGDDWQIDARVLKWHGAAGGVGFEPPSRGGGGGGRFRHRLPAGAHRRPLCRCRPRARRDPHRIRIASPSASRRVDAASALSQLSAMGRYALLQ